MAKQTFTTGQVLTAAQMTSLQQTAMLGGAANAKIASYVLIAADAGDAITMSNASPTTITVNTGLFATGDIVTIINLGAGACTITAGTATVATSGSLVLATNQGGVLRFTSASAAIFFQFATPASGDIEGVTAGVGISGGGTSGTVTITNDMATTITAAGDIVVGTGSGTYDNLPIGTTAQVLTADTTVSPYKVKWATPASGSSTYVGCAAYNTSNYSISNNTGTNLTWNTEEFDTDGFHSTSSNTSRFTIPTGKGGKYLIAAQVRWDDNTAGERVLKIQKNGSEMKAFAMQPNSSNPMEAISAVLELVATDYIEILVYQNSGGARTVYASSLETFTSISSLGA